MTDYAVTVVHTLRIVGTVGIRARSEDAAVDQAQQMAAEGRFGTVSWELRDSVVADWYEEDTSLDIEDATEEETT